MNSKFRIIKKWLLRGLLVLVGIILVAFAYLYAKKDSIAKDLLLDLNSQAAGEILVEKVDINPFVHFPYVSLSLKQTRLFETKKSERNANEDPILDIDQLYISFDILELMRSRVEIERVSAVDGTVHLTEGENGVLNIEKALQPPKKPKSTNKNSENKKAAAKDSAPKQQKPKTDKTAAAEKPTDSSFALDINRLVLNNISVTAAIPPGDPQQEFTIVDSKASFKYVQDSIACELDADFKIDRLGLDHQISIEDEQLSTKLDIYFDKGEQLLSVYQGDIDFRNTRLHTRGTIDFKDKGMADLSFEAGDQNMAFTRLFLTAEGIDNLKSGQLYLQGTVKGPIKDQIPEIKCYFGAKNMTVEIPKTGDYIRDLEIDGHFSSGTLADLSEALLILDTLHAHLPTGYIRMASKLKNFKDPVLKYNLDASFRLENLSKIIDLNPIEGLGGRVTLTDSYQGALTQEAISHDLVPEEFELQLDSLRFEIPEVVDIAHLSGHISGHIDSFRIDSLAINSGDSDLLVNGAIRKLSNFIFQTDTLVTANVEISSKLFDFPYLFRALPNTASAFPYIIRDVEVNVGLETSRQKLKVFRKVPEMDFAIHEVAASIDSLLDYVRLREGSFKMHEDEKAFFLDFDDFELLTDGTSSEAEFRFIEETGKRDSMTFALRTEGINPSQLFAFEKEKMPSAADAWLSGDYSGFIVLPGDKDSTRLFHHAILDIKDFSYIAKDTLTASSFHFETKNMSYEVESTESVLATLDSENDFYFKRLGTPFFQSDSLGLYVNTRNGVISISPHDHETFGEDETGTVLLYPYEDPPRFELDYTINDLPLEDFLEAFNSEKLLSGTVDINLDLDATGLDVEQITSSLSGAIDVVGDSLKLHGLNLDDVIKDFQRSQSFNLVDVGAVVLAGPAGIVYSKGSSYVSLLTADKNDSTQISKFSSKWLLDSGKISVDDVAFATLKNRVAAKGWLDMSTDSLDITIGVLNDKGCAIFNQRIYGNADQPEYSKVKFLKTLLAPVTNVVKGALGVKCDVFYDGIVTHPEKQPKGK